MTRRLTVVLLACAAAVALVTGPALFTKHELGKDPSNDTFIKTFDYIGDIAPDLDFDARAFRDEKLRGAGGAEQPVRCVEVRNRQTPPWLCATLSSDGERAAAAWFARKPSAPPQQIVLVDDDPATRPNL